MEPGSALAEARREFVIEAYIEGKRVLQHGELDRRIQNGEGEIFLDNQFKLRYRVIFSSTIDKEYWQSKLAVIEDHAPKVTLADRYNQKLWMECPVALGKTDEEFRSLLSVYASARRQILSEDYLYAVAETEVSGGSGVWQRLEPSVCVLDRKGFWVAGFNLRRLEGGIDDFTFQRKFPLPKVQSLTRRRRS